MQASVSVSASIVIRGYNVLSNVANGDLSVKIETFSCTQDNNFYLCIFLQKLVKQKKNKQEIKTTNSKETPKQNKPECTVEMFYRRVLFAVFMLQNVLFIVT